MEKGSQQGMGTQHRKISGRRKGFTLVEILVAAMILIIPIAGILLSYLRCLELNEVSTNMSLAVQAARSRMEDIRSTPFSQIKATYDKAVFHPADMTSATGVSYVDELPSGQLLVTLSVSWEQPNGRIFGEDSNLNGQIDAGEDINGNGKLDSPVELTDIITQY